MSMNWPVEPDRYVPSRPTGVWILTIYALVFAGLYPMALSITLLVTGNAGGAEWNLLLSLPLSLAIIVSAVIAWKGSNTGRIAFIVLVALNYVLIGVNNFLALGTGNFPAELRPQMFLRIASGVLMPLIYIWYFCKRSTLEYYRYKNKK